MTVPGGVPNLPMGALSLDTISDTLHDMTPTAMRGRASARIPSTFNVSLGGNPTSDNSFFGVMMHLFSGFNSAIANADPMDISGPEDLPGVLTNFIDELPVIGPLIELMKSIIEGDFEFGDLLTAIEDSFNSLGAMLGLPAPAFSVEDIINWFKDNVAAIGELISDAVQQVQDLLTGITDATPTEFDDWLVGLLTGDSDLNAGNLVGTIPGLGELRDALVQGFRIDTATGWAVTDVFNAASDVKREQAEIAAGLAQLQADKAAQYNSGRSFTVDVSDYGTSMPSVFTKFLDSGSGAVVNDGDTLNYLSSTGVELFEYNVDELATDYFEVSVVAPKKPGEYFFDYGSRSVYLIGRKNTAGTSYCFARIRGDSVRVGAAIDGTSTFASPTWFGSSQAFQWGSYLTFRGGTDAGSRWFQVLSNNRLRATFNDAAAVSLLGSGYRRVGFGLENEDNDLLERAPNISHFNANDNVPVDYPGTGGRMYRTSTGTVNLSSGAFVLPSNFFGNAEQVSDDLTYDLTTGKWTVTNAGRYYVKFSTRTTEGAFPNRMVFALYRNGSAELYGGHTWARFVTGAGTNLTPGWLADEWVIPLAAGDYVQIGYDTTGAASDVLTGTASGLSTYFSITKLS